MGLVFDIKHYAVHDGPGIRTTVFLKGCPLDCPWCHNPESKDFKPELMWTPARCIGCRSCVETCPTKAIQLTDKLQIDHEKCNLCGTCVSNCYPGALERVGKEMTLSEVMEEISKDLVFYEESGGGVTFSGGEPLSQPEFLLDLLISCKEKGIHTTVDTSGHGDPETISLIKPYVDLFLYDLKHMDSQKHEKYTGVPNEQVLKNLRLLKESRVLIRVPVIPGVNSDDSNISALGKFLSGEGFKELCLLPYHRVGMEKLERLTGNKRESYYSEPPTAEVLDKIKSMLEDYGLNVRIGG